MTTYKEGSMLIQKQWGSSDYSLIGLGHTGFSNALYKTGSLTECMEGYQEWIEKNGACDLHIEHEPVLANTNTTVTDLDALGAFKATAPYPLREFQGKIVEQEEPKKGTIEWLKKNPLR
jgi:hypothetical protein